MEIVADLYRFWTQRGQILGEKLTADFIFNKYLKYILIFSHLFFVLTLFPNCHPIESRRNSEIDKECGTNIMEVGRQITTVYTRYN